MSILSTVYIVSLRMHGFKVHGTPSHVGKVLSNYPHEKFVEWCREKENSPLHIDYAPQRWIRDSVEDAKIIFTDEMNSLPTVRIEHTQTGMELYAFCLSFEIWTVDPNTRQLGEMVDCPTEVWSKWR